MKNLLYLLLIFAGPGFAQQKASGLHQAVLRLDAQYGGFYPWMARLYDPEVGGFRMAISSTKDKLNYQAGIESTSQAIEILQTSGQFAAMPADMKTQLIHFYQVRQHAGNGFFYDTDPCTGTLNRLLGRALFYTKPILEAFGVQPLYPYPQEKSILSVYPEMASPELFTGWLKALDWKGPWGAGDKINARISVLKSLPEAQREKLLPALWAFLESIQSAQTGLWGLNPQQIDYDYVSGAFKVALVYDQLGGKVPNCDKIYHSMLTCMRREKADKYTFVRNPLSLLHVIRPQLSFQISRAERLELINLTVEKNSHFLKSDGGFSRLWGAGYRGDTPCLWSAGLAEGDLNSGTQAINQVRKVCYELAGEPMLPLPGAKTFYTELARYGSWQHLNDIADHAGKAQWRPVLQYVAKLHQRSTHPPVAPFKYDWEEIGPGYVYAPAFGHWDLIHEAIDVMPGYPQHSLEQLYNNIENQQADGLVPGAIWMPGGKSKRDSVSWNHNSQGHPPVWVLAVDAYVKQTGDTSVLRQFYGPLIRQLTWFENNRRAEGEGFFYNDILLKKWESGVDEGIRFDEVKQGKYACVDATSHVYLLYQTAVAWGGQLGLDTGFFDYRAKQLKHFICDSLYDAQSGLFADRWAVKDRKYLKPAFESMWPLVVGAAKPEQARRYLRDFLLNPKVFLTEHPVATVGRNDPAYEKRMWRGPAWNSMSYWAAVACLNYGDKTGAKTILAKALDDTEKQFERTGTIWEFYDADGAEPENVARKPTTKFNQPSKDYLGHNPLLAMAILYDSLK